MWSTELKLLLIQEVRKRECLWNISSPLHTKRHNIELEWAAIGTKLNSTGEKVKSEWKKLRIYFMTLRRKATETNSGNGLDDSFIPSWVFYHKMKFILPPFITSPSTSRLGISSPLTDEMLVEYESSEMSTEEDVTYIPINKSTVKEEKVTESPKYYHERLSLRSRKQRFQKKMDEEASNPNVERTNTISVELNSKQKQTSDDYFCVLLCDHLKQIPDCLAKEKCKLKLISDVVELKHSKFT